MSEVKTTKRVCPHCHGEGEVQRIVGADQWATVVCTVCRGRKEIEVTLQAERSEA